MGIQSLPPNIPRNRPRAKDPLLLLWLLFALGAVAIYVVPILAKLRLFKSDPSAAMWQFDFSNYWQAARLTLDGAQQILFEPTRYLAYLQTEFGQGHQLLAWSYPPHFLLFIWPLGYLSFTAALTTFLLVTFALFAVSIVVFHRKFARGADLKLTFLALIPYALITTYATQNGFFTAAVTLLALTFMNDRPVVAGLALAVLTVKPQLGFLFPLVALLDRNWALLRWATLFTLVLVALSAILFGLTAWRDFFVNIIPNQQAVMATWNGTFLFMMPTTFGSLRVLGIDPSLAFGLHCLVAIAAGVATWWLLRRLRDPLPRAFVLLAGTLLISPYAFNYDMGALCVTAALVAQIPQARHLRTAAIGIALIAVFPGLLAHLALSRLPVTPLLLAAGLAALWHIERDGSAHNGPALEPPTRARS
jgi:hypothetical protein